jgi:DNA-binding response OmpR family regulator
MPDQLKAITFDVDETSLGSIREGLPGWEVEEANSTSRHPLHRDWNPGGADLLVVGTRDAVGETLGLCRCLRSQAGRAHTPLLVLVPAAQDELVKEVLDAGADKCLVLPVHAKQVASMWAHVGTSHRPGSHSLNLDPACREDPWRDEGGQG